MDSITEGFESQDIESSTIRTMMPESDKTPKNNKSVAESSHVFEKKVEKDEN